MEDTFGNLISRLAAQLIRSNLKMAAAESCTGGWISKACTDMPGSSAWFERGFVSYSNEAKNELLGVRPETLERFGAVSREVAEEMALGALSRAPVGASVAVTGIAGPDGGSEEKPVGTVWFGWAFSEARSDTRCVRFDGDRMDVRRQTVIYALEGLIQRLA